jgi:fucose permease
MRPAFTRDRYTWLAYLMLGYFAYLPATLGPLMPFLRTELGLSYRVASLHFSAHSIGWLLMGALGGWLTRRLGRTVAFWGGASAMTCGALLLVAFPFPLVTILGASLMGMFGGLLLVTIQATLADHHGNNRAIAFAESNVIASICSMLAPVAVGGFERAGWGWRSSVALIVVVLLILILVFRSVSIPRRVQPAGDTRVTQARLPAVFWSWWVVLLFGSSVEWCLMYWGADYLEHAVALSKATAATSMSMLFGAIVVGRIAGSRLVRHMSSNRLLLAALVTACIGLLMMWLAPLPLVNLAGLCIAGLGIANVYPLTLAVAANAAPSQPDQVSARLMLSTGTAGLTAPFLLGWLADQITIRPAFGMVVALVIAAILAALFAARRTRTHRHTAIQAGQVGA